MVVGFFLSSFREECKSKPTNNLGKSYKEKETKIAGRKPVYLNCAFKERKLFVSPLGFCGKLFSEIHCCCSAPLLQDMFIWRENPKLMT